MIKFEHTDVYGFEHAIRGMRNPFDSWDKSDSEWKDNLFTQLPEFHIGETDAELCHKLNKGGSPHNKFLRQIVCWVDITAPRYWWTEASTYRFGVEVNSCSTMHTILKDPFRISDFSFEKLPGFKNNVKQFKPDVDEEHEEWKDWNGYKVSSEGRIMGKRGRILSGSLHDDGYLCAYINGKQVPYHRVIAECFCEGYDPSLTVNHIDGNKLNNRASNLEWITMKENHKHAMENGLQPVAVYRYKGKFTPEQREEIKNLWDTSDLSMRAIARKYGVSHTTIRSIINDRYKYIQRTNAIEEVAKPIVDTLIEMRDAWYASTSESAKQTIWNSIIELLPQSYNQKRTVMMSYQAIRSICEQRKGHKLKEWHEFIDWARRLPNAWLLFDDLYIEPEDPDDNEPWETKAAIAAGR